MERRIGRGGKAKREISWLADWLGCVSFFIWEVGPTAEGEEEEEEGGRERERRKYRGECVGDRERWRGGMETDGDPAMAGLG